MLTSVFLNLLINSLFSLAAGILVVLLFSWFFRIETGPWKLFLFSLPFFKIVVDWVGGLPKDSVLYAGIDPFSLPAHHQLLTLGASFNEWGPNLRAAFAVNDLSGKRYASSFGDYLTIWLHRKFSEDILLMVVLGFCFIAMLLLSRRLVFAARFEKQRRADRPVAQSLPAQRISMGFFEKTVDIYVSQTFSGTPFTGGFFSPYICIPQDAFENLSEEERQAVISHEMGHIRQWDVLVSALIQLLGDVFWFIPGYRYIGKKIDRLRELVADQWAVKSGQNPAWLASALIKLKEIPDSKGNFILYSAFFREKSLLKVRVNRLLGHQQDPGGRFGWQNKWLRILYSFWIFTAVVFSSLGGNQRAISDMDLNRIADILRFLGFN